MIKVSLFEVFEAVPVLKKLSGQECKGSTAFKIARLIKELQPEMELLESKREEIIKKYLEKNEDGSNKIFEDGNMHIKNEFIETCNKELNELFNTKIEILSDGLDEEMFENFVITPQEILSLNMFIK